VHPAAADVERPQRPVEVEPAEAEPALGVLEGHKPPSRPGVEDGGFDLADARPARPLELCPHLLEAGVRVVDVGLLGCQFLVHEDSCVGA